MKLKKVLIFDFDGTIADTLTAMIDSYNEIAPQLNLRVVDKKEIAKSRGLGARELMKQYGVSLIKLSLLTMKIREKMREKIKRAPTIKGMDLALKELKAKDFVLGILTSSPQANVRIFLRKEKIDHFFSFIYTGKNLFGKEKVIKRLLKDKKLSLDQVIYIGDEVRDVEAVKKVGFPIIAVSWGFNNRAALIKAAPDQIIDRPSQLMAAIKALSARK